MPTIGSRHFRNVRDMSDISNSVLLTLVQTMNSVILSRLILLRRWVVNRDMAGTIVKSTIHHISGLCVPDGDPPIFFHILDQPQLRHTRRVASFTHITPLIGFFFRQPSILFCQSSKHSTKATFKLHNRAWSCTTPALQAPALTVELSDTRIPAAITGLPVCQISITTRSHILAKEDIPVVCADVHGHAPGG